jgi:tRNA(fMet)-specific endonuclease VapC
VWILDTDSLTALFHQRPVITARVLAAGAGSVVITVVSEMEQLRGRYQQVFTAANATELMAAQRRLDETKAFLVTFTVLPFDDAAAQQFERLLADRRLRSLRRADLLIATIALRHQATVVTRNARDFRKVTGLRIEDWSV